MMERGNVIMDIVFMKYRKEDLQIMKEAWNDILDEGVAFPGLDLYDLDTFQAMLHQQDAVTGLYVNDVLQGYYILHPNNIGRCSHVANASYVMLKESRGKHLGKSLVEHSLIEAKQLGFRGMQFNAVVASNTKALHIYETLGFQKIGKIEGGFLLKNGVYSDMYIFYKSLL